MIRILEGGIMIWTLSIVLVSLLLIMCLYNFFTAPRLEQIVGAPEGPKVSVLIAARNEADHLRTNIPKIFQSNYKNFEVVVLDDESTDDTAAVLKDFQKQYSGKFTVVTGSKLPEGWERKSWASHELGLKATGKILIFCDADIEVGAEDRKSTRLNSSHSQ